jgi:hypothetical protein
VHLFVEVRQLVLTRPASNLLGLPIGSPVGILVAAIPLLKEALVIPFELVIENHSPDLTALLADALLGTLVSAIDVGVVRQLARPVHAGVELLLAVIITNRFLPGFDERCLPLTVSVSWPGEPEPQVDSSLVRKCRWHT